ncbi:MAG: VWA domain-containing protein [Pirellulales bacterium]|nr:VWA domain-containing protein [Pirellulales bacterium]
MSTAAENAAEAGPRSGPALPLIDGEAAAWGLSLLVHLLALAVLTAATMALPTGSAPVSLSLPTPELPEFEALTQQFVSSDLAAEEIGALAAGGADGALAAAAELSERSLVALEAEFLADAAERPAVELDTEISHGPELTPAINVQGAGAVDAAGAEGAIDRLTHEILASLEQRPTLVVWLFDQSGSLHDERASILKRFRRVYEELGVIEAADNPAFRRHKDKPLLTAVVGFGAQPRMLTSEPTDRIDQIEQAVQSIDDDETGQENVFQAVAMVAERFRGYRSASNGKRHVMIIVFTDEAGDDAAAADDAISTCRKLAMPVYVVGRPAPFGRQTAYVKWIDPDPKFDQRPQWVPVTLGPESVMPELLKLRFAGRGDEEELLDSGFGPYALTRLCYETGGLYFAVHPNRAVGRRISGEETSKLAAHFTAFFDPDAMRRYQPDYVSTAEYLRLIQTNAARGALIQAAEMTWTSPMEDVRLRFPKRDEAELAQALSLAQRSAAILQPKIDLICQTLLAGEEDRARLKEPRWQAGYDLALGRALAVKVRTDGYNIMLAEAKQGKAFKDPKNNTWVLHPDEHFSATAVEKAAAKARTYLERVVHDHAGTPWAMLAERELSTPLGWRWEEDYTNIPPRQEAGANRPPRPEAAPQGPPRRDPPPL